jgi:glutamate dehydrogenase
MAGTDTLPDRSLETPVDMASLEAAQNEKRRLLDDAAAAAATLMDGQAALPAGVRAADAPALMRRFFAGEPAAGSAA